MRHAHPALQDLRSLKFHPTSSNDVIAYSKRVDDDVILVVCLMDPHREQEATVWWNLPDLGLDDRFIAHDLVTDTTWTWSSSTYVRLRPWEQVAHIVHARPIT